MIWVCACVDAAAYAPGLFSDVVTVHAHHCLPSTHTVSRVHQSRNERRDMYALREAVQPLCFETLDMWPAHRLVP